MAFQGSGALSGAASGLTTGLQAGAQMNNPKAAAIMAAVGLVGGGLAGGFGGGRVKRAENRLGFEMDALSQQQQLRANAAQQQLDELERPTIGAEVDRLNEVARLAEQYAREGMPEAQRQAAAQDIERSQAMQLGAAGSLGAGLRGLGTTQASTANAYRNLAAQDAMIAQQNQGQYLGALNALSQAEARQEQFNVVDPYYEDFNRLYMEQQAMQGAAQQNRMMGLNYDLMLQQQRMGATQQGAQDLLGVLSTGGAGSAVAGLAGGTGGMGGAESGAVTALGSGG